MRDAQGTKDHNIKQMRNGGYLLLAIIVIGQSCSNETNITAESSKMPIVVAKDKELKILKEGTTDSVVIDHFKNIPAEIDGCSCYFSETKQRFDKSEYLFAANFDSLAYISINKKLTRLKLVSTTKEPNTFGDHDHLDIYSNGTYKVKVDIKYKRSIDTEVWWNEGTITVEGADGRKGVKRFVGECGC